MQTNDKYKMQHWNAQQLIKYSHTLTTTGTSYTTSLATQNVTKWLVCIYYAASHSKQTGHISRLTDCRL